MNWFADRVEHEREQGDATERKRRVVGGGGSRRPDLEGMANQGGRRGDPRSDS